MRRYPRVNGPAALPLFCLAPHGVFRASRIAPRAVSSYLAFSPLPDLCCQRTGGVFSVTLSVTAILQARCPRVLRGMSPYGVRTFLQQAASRSPAIICHRRQFSISTIEGKRTADYAGKNGRIQMRCAEEHEGAGLGGLQLLLTSRDVSTPLDMTRTRMAAARS